jgi:tetratricopeptide (TPR) repeat protein
LQEAEASYRRSAELTEALVRESPGRSAYRELAGFTWSDLGITLYLAGREREAESAFRRAIAEQERLAHDFPKLHGYRDELAASCGNLAELLRAGGRLDDAEAPAGLAVATLERLVKDFPDLPEYRAHLASFLGNQASLLGQRGRYADAMVTSRRSLSIFDALIAEQPLSRAYRVDRSEERNRLVRLLADCPDSQIRAPDEAIRLARQGVADDPKEGAAWSALGVALYRAGDPTTAAEALQTSLQLGPEDPTTAFFLSLSLAHAGDRGTAREWYGKAVRWTEKNTPKDPELLRLRTGAAALLGLSGEPKAAQKEMNHSK